METSAADLIAGGYKGVIISGGPNSVYAEDAPSVHEDLFDAGSAVVRWMMSSSASGVADGASSLLLFPRYMGHAWNMPVCSILCGRGFVHLSNSPAFSSVIGRNGDLRRTNPQLSLIHI